MKRFPRSPITFASAKVCPYSAPRCHPEFRSHLDPARARERGTTLLESAVMISVLLLMMFGIIGFGTALYTYHFVSNTAREATRWASVRGSTCGGLSGGGPAGDTDVKVYVQNLSTFIGLD